MNTTPEIEKKLWAAAGVSRISDIPGFPFDSHAALKAAVAAGEAQFGIEYAAARDLVPISKPTVASALILALTWVTPLLAVGSIVVAFVTGNWWALCGVVSSFLGQTLANPCIPARSLWKILVAAAVAHIFVTRKCRPRGRLGILLVRCFGDYATDPQPPSLEVGARRCPRLGGGRRSSL
jgi:hypothetical protein